MKERGRLFGGAAIPEGFNQAFRYKGLHFLLLVSSIFFSSIYFEEYPYPLTQPVTIVF